MTALSAVETEQLRELRARLNRVPKGAMGDKSVGPLSKGFFDVCARVDLGAGESPGPAAASAPLALLEAAQEADMTGLRDLVSTLAGLRQGDPARWRAIFDQGVPSTILTRRLVLGGKERT